MTLNGKSEVWATDATRWGRWPVPDGAKLSSISSLHTKEKQFQQTRQQKLAWVGLSGEISWTLKLLFPSVTRVWSTWTRGRDPLQQLWREVQFSVPRWGEQKSSSCSSTWKRWRQPHWKGSCWVSELGKNLFVYYLYRHDWSIFCMGLSGTQRYNTQVSAQK